MDELFEFEVRFKHGNLARVNASNAWEALQAARRSLTYEQRFFTWGPVISIHTAVEPGVSFVVVFDDVDCSAN